MMTSMLILSILTGSTRDGDRLAGGIAKLVAPKIDRGDSVGIVVGVHQGGRSRTFGFGRRAADVDAPPDGRTIFEIGSITKVFTSAALADMAREGLVRLDDPVATLLPAGVRVPDRDGRPITLRTLANHTSGLPRVIPKAIGRMLATGDPYADITADDVYGFLKGAGLQSAPGEKFSYSNVGAGLLGLALARKAGTSYEELILSRVCRPLGMGDTRVTLDAGQARRLAKPYARKGVPAQEWHFDALAGAGALRSTADDMLGFARANLGLAPTPARLRAAFKDMRTPTADLGRQGGKIGLAWLIPSNRAEPGRPEVFFHNGGTGGFRSYIAIVPSAEVAVVVLSNSAGEVDTLGEAVLKLILESRAREEVPE